MKKRVFSFVMTVILTLSMLCIPTTSAFADKTTQPSTEAIVNELSKFETPYIGIEAEDFDLDGDGRIDVFDLVFLKRKLINGEPGITVATVVKLQAWLLGKPDTWLEVRTLRTPWYDKPSNHATSIFQNLCSNDFRFVRASDAVLITEDGTYHPAVLLYFLGCDEYTLDSAYIYNFCYSADEMDEIICKNDGFVIGIKDNQYTLATTNPISPIDENDDPSKQTEAETTSPTETTEPQETTEVKEPEQTSAYVKYDLRHNPDTWTTEKVRNTVWDLSTLLKAESYTFTAKPYTSEWSPSNVTPIQLFGETGLSTVEIIVEEREPVKDTPIYWNDDFYLYYSNQEGFGICFSNK